MFQERRTRLLESMGPRACAILPTASVAIRNNDVEHEFRPDSDVFYLTGFDEPESILVLLPEHAEHRVVLFVRPRDPDREVWDGPRAGVEGAVKQFGADAAFPIGEFDAKLPALLAGRERLYYQLGVHRSLDDRVLQGIATQRHRSRKGGTWPTEIVDPAVVVHEMRWRKSQLELDLMRRAAEITRDGFERARETAVPGRHEYEVEAVLRAAFRSRGSERPAYSPIVASGANACVLHYVANNRRMEDGDLLLIDAGAEFNCYASDVTRTFPVNGRFTSAQRDIYELVLAAQLASIAAIEPGATVQQVHQRSVDTITQGLVKLGLLEGDPAELVTNEAYKRYFMHGTSHWIGMDVHDVGRYYHDASPRPMEPGCVLTVEPGIYVGPTDEKAPAKYRGIGVRIEDDVAVTPDGHRVLTHDIPKMVGELER
jgi:Xaa-Pro aminopeptidase